MKWTLPILVLALILAGCDSSGELRIINSTQNMLTFSVDGSTYELAGGTSHTVDLDVDEDWEIFETDSKGYVLFMEGETFLIWDSYNNSYTSYTEVDIENGKTLDVYAAPSHGCVKIVNQSDIAVTRVTYNRYRDGLLEQTNVEILDGDIDPGTSWYCRLFPSYDIYDVSYSFRIVLQDDTMIDYPEAIMNLDEVYLIELE